MSVLITILYIVSIVLVGISMNRIIGLSIHARTRKVEPTPPLAITELPTVTVQLPIYNEKLLVNRLIPAVCALDYPPDRLQIQILDDSTDETTSLITQQVEAGRAHGLTLEHVRRADRRGHKAGNLAHALPLATGEFIAIFDADFVPEPGWLRNAMRPFLQVGSERLGLVQTRWQHLNANDSLLTYAQDLAVDQFAIAQNTRTRLGLWSSFYGSAGVWRKACIVDAGGWSSATFSEDLEMAYRAQLCGWSLGYDGTILAAAELPPSMLAYKQQQFFWSKGNMQVTRILWKRLTNAPISLLQRIDAILFATWPVTHFLLLAQVIIQLLSLIWLPKWVMVLDFAAGAMLSVGFIPSLFDMARARLSIPIHLALGVGISVNNTRGLINGLFGPIGEDFRATTPRSADAKTHPANRGSVSVVTVAEVMLGVLSLIGGVAAVMQGRWILALILLHAAFGFGWVGGQSVSEVLRAQARRVTVTP